MGSLSQQNLLHSQITKIKLKIFYLKNLNPQHSGQSDNNLSSICVKTYLTIFNKTFISCIGEKQNVWEMSHLTPQDTLGLLPLIQLYPLLPTCPHSGRHLHVILPTFFVLINNYVIFNAFTFAKHRCTNYNKSNLPVLCSMFGIHFMLLIDPFKDGRIELDIYASKYINNILYLINILFIIFLFY